MLKVFAFIQNLPIRRDDRGITSVEYALLLVGIGVAVAALSLAFGTQLTNAFTKFAGNL